jgi:hypothetical protein
VLKNISLCFHTTKNERMCTKTIVDTSKWSSTGSEMKLKETILCTCDSNSFSFGMSMWFSPFQTSSHPIVALDPVDFHFWLIYLFSALFWIHKVFLILLKFGKDFIVVILCLSLAFYIFPDQFSSILTVLLPNLLSFHLLDLFHLICSSFMLIFFQCHPTFFILSEVNYILVPHGRHLKHLLVPI